MERTGLRHSGITVTTAAGVHAIPLAEHALLSLLYLRRDVPAMLESQRDRRWERRTSPTLAGSRVLIIGMGRVGSRIADLCVAFGMDVLALRRTASGSSAPVQPIARGDLRAVIPSLDALVVTCPLTRETFHLVGREELRSLAPTAVVVNVGRGAVIDEAALVDVLMEGRIAGAALDVFESEPLRSDSPLWGLPNVLVTPHTATGSFDENRLIVELFLDNLARYVAGQPLENQYDPARGY
jgi:phosphoglycerate dehydrogenase-like enzyme